MAVERLYERMPDGTSRSRFQAEFVETRDGERRVVLAKPQTFMNESGIAVAQLARWYKVPRDRLLVIYDDLDIPFGQIRLRANGSDGGHNGMTSIIQQLRSQEFARLRVGIDRPRTGSTVPYVLANFSATEQRELPELFDRVADAALVWLREGVTEAMNQFNRRASEAKPTAP
jgi:PTH1 family peptidyl-tRNA hydrolase